MEANQATANADLKPEIFDTLIETQGSANEGRNDITRMRPRGKSKFLSFMGVNECTVDKTQSQIEKRNSFMLFFTYFYHLFKKEFESKRV